MKREERRQRCTCTKLFLVLAFALGTFCITYETCAIRSVVTSDNTEVVKYVDRLFLLVFLTCLSFTLLMVFYVMYHIRTLEDEEENGRGPGDSGPSDQSEEGIQTEPESTRESPKKKTKLKQKRSHVESDSTEEYEYTDEKEQGDDGKKLEQKQTHKNIQTDTNSTEEDLMYSAEETKQSDQKEEISDEYLTADYKEEAENNQQNIQAGKDIQTDTDSTEEDLMHSAVETEEIYQSEEDSEKSITPDYEKTISRLVQLGNEKKHICNIEEMQATNQDVKAEEGRVTESGLLLKSASQVETGIDEVVTDISIAQDLPSGSAILQINETAQQPAKDTSSIVKEDSAENYSIHSDSTKEAIPQIFITEATHKTVEKEEKSMTKPEDRPVQEYTPEPTNVLHEAFQQEPFLQSTSIPQLASSQYLQDISADSSRTDEAEPVLDEHPYLSYSTDQAQDMVTKDKFKCRCTVEEEILQEIDTFFANPDSPIELASSLPEPSLRYSSFSTGFRTPSTDNQLVQGLDVLQDTSEHSSSIERGENIKGPLMSSVLKQDREDVCDTKQDIQTDTHSAEQEDLVQFAEEAKQINKKKETGDKKLITDYIEKTKNDEHEKKPERNIQISKDTRTDIDPTKEEAIPQILITEATDETVEKEDEDLTEEKPMSKPEDKPVQEYAPEPTNVLDEAFQQEPILQSTSIPQLASSQGLQDISADSSRTDEAELVLDEHPYLSYSTDQAQDMVTKDKFKCRCTVEEEIIQEIDTFFENSDSPIELASNLPEPSLRYSSFCTGFRTPSTDNQLVEHPHVLQDTPECSSSFEHIGDVMSSLKSSTSEQDEGNFCNKQKESVKKEKETAEEINQADLLISILEQQAQVIQSPSILQDTTEQSSSIEYREMGSLVQSALEQHKDDVRDTQQGIQIDTSPTKEENLLQSEEEAKHVDQNKNSSNKSLTPISNQDKEKSEQNIQPDKHSQIDTVSTKEKNLAHSTEKSKQIDDNLKQKESEQVHPIGESSIVDPDTRKKLKLFLKHSIPQSDTTEQFDSQQSESLQFAPLQDATAQSSLEQRSKQESKEANFQQTGAIPKTIKKSGKDKKTDEASAIVYKPVESIEECDEIDKLYTKVQLMHMELDQNNAKEDSLSSEEVRIIVEHWKEEQPILVQEAVDSDDDMPSLQPPNSPILLAGAGNTPDQELQDSPPTPFLYGKRFDDDYNDFITVQPSYSQESCYTKQEETVQKPVVEKDTAVQLENEETNIFNTEEKQDIKQIVETQKDLVEESVSQTENETAHALVLEQAETGTNEAVTEIPIVHDLPPGPTLLQISETPQEPSKDTSSMVKEDVTENKLIHSNSGKKAIPQVVIAEATNESIEKEDKGLTEEKSMSEPENKPVQDCTPEPLIVPIEDSQQPVNDRSTEMSQSVQSISTDSSQAEETEVFLNNHSSSDQTRERGCGCQTEEQIMLERKRQHELVQKEDKETTDETNQVTHDIIDLLISRVAQQAIVQENRPVRMSETEQQVEISNINQELANKEVERQDDDTKIHTEKDQMHKSESTVVSKPDENTKQTAQHESEKTAEEQAPAEPDISPDIESLPNNTFKETGSSPNIVLEQQIDITEQDIKIPIQYTAIHEEGSQAYKITDETQKHITEEQPVETDKKLFEEEQVNKSKSTSELSSKPVKFTKQMSADNHLTESVELLPTQESERTEKSAENENQKQVFADSNIQQEEPVLKYATKEIGLSQTSVSEDVDKVEQEMAIKSAVPTKEGQMGEVKDSSDSDSNTVAERKIQDNLDGALRDSLTQSVDTKPADQSTEMIEVPFANVNIVHEEEVNLKNIKTESLQTTSEEQHEEILEEKEEQSVKREQIFEALHLQPLQETSRQTSPNLKEDEKNIESEKKEVESSAEKQHVTDAEAQTFLNFIVHIQEVATDNEEEQCVTDTKESINTLKNDVQLVKDSLTESASLEELQPSTSLTQSDQSHAFELQTPDDHKKHLSQLELGEYIARKLDTLNFDIPQQVQLEQDLPEGAESSQLLTTIQKPEISSSTDQASEKKEVESSTEKRHVTDTEAQSIMESKPIKLLETTELHHQEKQKSEAATDNEKEQCVSDMKESINTLKNDVKQVKDSLTESAPLEKLPPSPSLTQSDQSHASELQTPDDHKKHLSQLELDEYAARRLNTLNFSFPQQVQLEQDLPEGAESSQPLTTVQKPEINSSTDQASEEAEVKSSIEPMLHGSKIQEDSMQTQQIEQFKKHKQSEQTEQFSPQQEQTEETLSDDDEEQGEHKTSATSAQQTAQSKERPVWYKSKSPSKKRRKGKKK